MDTWEIKFKELNEVLSSLSATDTRNLQMDSDTAFSKCCDLLSLVRKTKSTCFFIGNGASASMASHFSADMAKNGRLRTQSFTDLSLITAVGNDISFSQIFSQPLAWYCSDSDVLIAISSSGNSPNVVEGVEAARQKKCKVITLSAMQPDNKIRSMGDINFYVPANTYGLAETGHNAILHHLMDLVEAQANPVNADG